MSESSTVSLDVIQPGKACDSEARGVNRKREQVLAVATECFLSRGYEGASINAMSRGSGISKESIYRYFGSKKELFEAVIERELEEYQRKLDRLETTHGAMELRDALVVVAETALTVVASEKMLALRRLVLEEATRSPELGHYYYRIGPERAFAALRKLLVEHVGQCEFDHERLARYFIAMTSFSIMVERQCRVVGELTREDIGRLAESIVDDFVSAFLSGRTSPSR